MASRMNWEPDLNDQTYYLAFTAGMKWMLEVTVPGATDAVKKIVESQTAYRAYIEWTQHTSRAVADGTLPHQYQSTACQHALHEECRSTCKFCDMPCSCSCHALKMSVVEAGTRTVAGESDASASTDYL